VGGDVVLERVGLLLEHGDGTVVGKVVLLPHLERRQVKRLVGLAPRAREEFVPQQAVGHAAVPVPLEGVARDLLPFLLRRHVTAAEHLRSECLVRDLRAFVEHRVDLSGVLAIEPTGCLSFCAFFTLCCARSARRDS